jgi:alpha-beta hydrolase superfamily lysophospholipase
MFARVKGAPKNLGKLRGRRVLWWVALAVVLMGAPPLFIFARAFWLEYSSFRDPPVPVDGAVAHREVPLLVDVSIPSPSGALRGWFVPGTQRAAVVLLHGAGGSRAELLPELEILSRAGLSVLAMDWPGAGESEGLTQWGATEIAALHAALDWLGARAEVDPARMGAFAFSLGTWITLREAVNDPRLRALALAGAPASMVDLSLLGSPRGGRLALWAAIYADRARGMPIGTDEPGDLVKRLSRPLLVIAGSMDTTVPEAMSRQLFESAGAPKEWLVVPDAGHGEYAKKGGDLYAARLGAFFVDALRAPPPPRGP